LPAFSASVRASSGDSSGCSWAGAALRHAAAALVLRALPISSELAESTPLLRPALLWIFAAASGVPGSSVATDSPALLSGSHGMLCCCGGVSALQAAGVATAACAGLRQGALLA
jgi:hypothetical protein